VAAAATTGITIIKIVAAFATAATLGFHCPSRCRHFYDCAATLRIWVGRWSGLDPPYSSRTSDSHVTASTFRSGFLARSSHCPTRKCSSYCSTAQQLVWTSSPSWKWSLSRFNGSMNCSHLRTEARASCLGWWGRLRCHARGCSSLSFLFSRLTTANYCYNDSFFKAYCWMRRLPNWRTAAATSYFGANLH
jgi:hypothetical protein